MTPAPLGHAEQLTRGPCGRGCGAEVLVGEDGVVFDAKPEWVLENPNPNASGPRWYAGFEQPDGVYRVVTRARLWFEHRCRLGSVEPVKGALDANARDAASHPAVGHIEPGAAAAEQDGD